MWQAALPILAQVSDDLLEQHALQMIQLHEDDTPLQQTLYKMEKVAQEESIPMIGALEGRILAALISIASACQPPARELLDIGTVIGYSAIWLSSEIGPEGYITSFEIDPVRAARAREFVRRDGVEEQVEIIVGDVFELLPQLNKKYDVIFQDVMKHVYLPRIQLGL
jgi:caffeoyl-CoA O-methyltransferase